MSAFMFGATVAAEPERFWYVPDSILSALPSGPDMSLPDGPIYIDVTDPEPPAWVDHEGPPYETELWFVPAGVYLRGVPGSTRQPIPTVNRVVIWSGEYQTLRAYWPATPGTDVGDGKVRDVFDVFGVSASEWLDQRAGERVGYERPLTAGINDVFVVIHLSSDESGDDHYVEVTWR